MPKLPYMSFRWPRVTFQLRHKLSRLSLTTIHRQTVQIAILATNHYYSTTTTICDTIIIFIHKQASKLCQQKSSLHEKTTSGILSPQQISQPYLKIIWENQCQLSVPSGIMNDGRLPVSNVTDDQNHNRCQFCDLLIFKKLIIPGPKNLSLCA